MANYEEDIIELIRDSAEAAANLKFDFCSKIAKGDTTKMIAH